MITGEIKAAVVVVYGKIKGIIDSEKLEIKGTSAVTWDIFVDVLVVEEGGYITAAAQ